MTQKGAFPQQKKTYTQTQNPLETLKDLGSSTVDKTASEFKKIGTGIFDQFFGTAPGADRNPTPEELKARFSQESKAAKPASRREFSIFNYQDYYERELVKKQIKELSEQIRKEIEFIKKANAALLSEISDVQKLAIDALPEKPGIYHIRFLEIVLSLLRSLRAKVGESRTWLSAMNSKRKKRGSLFASLSKKKGTQYSMSQELSTSRSVQ